MAELSEFYRGFLFGFFAAGVLGYTAQQIRLARKIMGAPDRPQTVTLKTEKTPRQVVREGQAAAVSFLFWLIMLAAELVALWQLLPHAR